MPWSTRRRVPHNRQTHFFLEVEVDTVVPRTQSPSFECCELLRNVLGIGVATSPRGDHVVSLIYPSFDLNVVGLTGIDKMVLNFNFRSYIVVV